MHENDLLSSLALLDPADAHIDVHGPRARADLDAILRTDRRVLHAPVRREPSRPTSRRLILMTAAAAALVVGVVALPPLLGGDTAFASWTASPRTLSGEQRESAAEYCREALLGGGGTDSDALTSAAPAIAEARGAWTSVLLTGPGGFSALCITDTSARPFGDMIGSVGSAERAVAPRQVVASDLGTGTMSAGEISLAAGLVGADITAMTYTSSREGPVHATVAEGHFLFWLPGAELLDASTEGVDVTVTHTDGTATTLRLRLEQQGEGSS